MARPTFNDISVISENIATPKMQVWSVMRSTYESAADFNREWNALTDQDQQELYELLLPTS